MSSVRYYVDEHVGSAIVRGLRRRGVDVITVTEAGMRGRTDEAQLALKEAYKILFREGLTIPNALERIEKKWPAIAEIEYLVRFVRSSERGIAR